MRCISSTRISSVRSRLASDLSEAGCLESMEFMFVSHRIDHAFLLTLLARSFGNVSRSSS